MVLGNKISRFFKGVKDKFNSFAKKQTTDAIRKNTTEKVSESVRDRSRKRKVKTSRWSKLSWTRKILSLTFNELGEKSRVYLAKNWFGTFSPVGDFNFKRGSRTPKTVFKRGKEKYSIV